MVMGEEAFIADVFLHDWGVEGGYEGQKDELAQANSYFYHPKADKLDCS